MLVQERLAAYINDMGIKQTTICQKTGMANDTLSNILRGNRKLTADEFEGICLAIQKAPNDFMNCYTE